MKTFRASAALLALLACSDDVTQPVDATPDIAGFIGATLNEEGWSAFGTVVRLDDGYVLIKGVSFVSPQRQIQIVLRLRPTPGAPQLIGTGYETTASVVVRSETVDAWTADGTRGSGTITLTSLTATGAAGKFDFIADAIRATQQPATYRAVRGTFSVPFENSR